MLPAVNIVQYRVKERQLSWFTRYTELRPIAAPAVRLRCTGPMIVNCIGFLLRMLCFASAGYVRIWVKLTDRIDGMEWRKEEGRNDASRIEIASFKCWWSLSTVMQSRPSTEYQIARKQYTLSCALDSALFPRAPLYGVAVSIVGYSLSKLQWGWITQPENFPLPLGGEGWNS